MIPRVRQIHKVDPQLQDVFSNPRFPSHLRAGAEPLDKFTGDRALAILDRVKAYPLPTAADIRKFLGIERSHSSRQYSAEIIAFAILEGVSDFFPHLEAVMPIMYLPSPKQDSNLGALLSMYCEYFPNKQHQLINFNAINIGQPRDAHFTGFVTNLLKTEVPRLFPEIQVDQNETLRRAKKDNTVVWMPASLL